MSPCHCCDSEWSIIILDNLQVFNLFNPNHSVWIENLYGAYCVSSYVRMGNGHAE